jgi:hypothetical protein
MIVLFSLDRSINLERPENFKFDRNLRVASLESASDNFVDLWTWMLSLAIIGRVKLVHCDVTCSKKSSVHEQLDTSRKFEVECRLRFLLSSVDRL